MNEMFMHFWGWITCMVLKIWNMKYTWNKIIFSPNIPALCGLLHQNCCQLTSPQQVNKSDWVLEWESDRTSGNRKYFVYCTIFLIGSHCEIKRYIIYRMQYPKNKETKIFSSWLFCSRTGLQTGPSQPPPIIKHLSVSFIVWQGNLLQPVRNSCNSCKI